MGAGFLFVCAGVGQLILCVQTTSVIPALSSVRNKAFSRSVEALAALTWWGIFFKLTWPDVIGSTHYQRQRCVWHCQEAVMVFQQCLFSGTGLSGALGQWTEAGVCFLKAMKPQGPQPFSVIWKISWPSCQCQVFSLWILRKFSLNCTFFVLPQTHEALSAIRSNYIIGDRPCPEIWQTWKTGERTQR